MSLGLRVVWYFLTLALVMPEQNTKDCVLHVPLSVWDLVTLWQHLLEATISEVSDTK